MVCSITIRFYEELNDFLKGYPLKEDIPFSFAGRRSVKDLIESFGVPHTEIDLILVNGGAVDFTYIVADGDRISVYPVFESMEIGGLSPLREIPLRDTRFVLDVHLGKLARDLRMLGFDSDYASDRDDPELAEISVSENRILLTRDRGLLKRSIVTHGLYIHSDQPEEQLKEILTKLDLFKRIRALTRCLVCNTPLIRLEGNELERHRSEIPPKVLERQKEFSCCLSCNKIYWKGDHWKNMVRRIKELGTQDR
ncbi:MAG: Mut7-C RNAse domain-containing protein [Spirochaetales bacterium]|nr:Mut7-C RNAse domain-containing protein [Spirochaetales bacterium]